MKFKNKLCSSLLAAAVVAGMLVPAQAEAEGSHPIYRVYNPNSGEHFYTAYSNELNNLIYGGWKYEGAAWTAPDSGWYVYRMYNPNVGDHHYTMDEDERDALVRFGWKYEGVCWASPYLGWTNPIPADAFVFPSQTDQSVSFCSAAGIMMRTGDCIRIIQTVNRRCVGWYGL